MSKYGDFLHADCGHSFAEWLGIEVPRYDFETRRGKFFYRLRSSRAMGEWKPLKKEAKASYKAALRTNRKESGA